MPFKNIIFDLGGVLLDIDYNKTVEAFRSLGVAEPEKAFSKAHQALVFRAFEKGELSPDYFLSQLQAAAPGRSSKELTKAWCALLGPMRQTKFRLLEILSASYRLFILSNTNEIHRSVFEAHIESVYGMDRFTSLFNKIHYSHHLGMRKPDMEIFEAVIQMHGIIPEETLFIDDTKIHVKAAEQSGLKALHLSEGQDLKTLLESVGVQAEKN